MAERNRRRIFLHRNEPSSAEGNAIFIVDGLSLATLKNQAGEKLGIKPVKRAFLGNGAEVISVEDIQLNANVYFSKGEPFYQVPRSKNGGTEKLQVAVLGAGGVGKSAITLRFVRDFFIKNWEATIEDAYRKTVRVDEEVSVLEILDTAGQEDFSSLRTQWMTDKDGYIFVYSLVDRSSLQEIYSFIELLEQVNENRDMPPIIFLGNKKDLIDVNPDSRKVLSEDVNELLAECNNMINRASGGIPDGRNWTTLHYETSALTGEKIDLIFDNMVREIRSRRKPSSTDKKKSSGSWCFLL